MESFGPWLRRERERCGITLEDISRSTKIRTRYLHAIEQEHLGELPGGIIGRGFVRAYASCIGVDEEEAIASYLAACAANQAQLPSPEPQPFVQRCCDRLMHLSPWVYAAGFVAIYFTVVALEHPQHYEQFHEPAAKQVSSLPSDSANASSPGSQSQGVKEARSTEASASEQSESRASKFALRQADTVLSSRPLSATSQSNTFTLMIKARQDSWMLIIADGQRVLCETLLAPAERSVEAHSLITVRAGNVGAVDFSFNGKSLPTQGTYDEARTLTFDASGLQARFPKAVLSPGPQVDSMIPAPVEQ
ncbi:MAG TPA: RodZ domain-containing protein [Terriglobales bacterium]|nr:RodZ domain-containing protein [Terriglobales bacterium]